MQYKNVRINLKKLFLKILGNLEPILVLESTKCVSSKFNINQFKHISTK